MARREVAFLALITEVEELTDDIAANARADGVIDASERHIIERAKEIQFALERGNLSRLVSQEFENSWDVEVKPGLKRRIRETLADQSRIRALWANPGRPDPDDGAPQLKAA